jgi:uncharacterized protein (DUF58 family)
VAHEPQAVDGVLRATAVAAIDDLELAARLVVEGLRSGQHRSPLHGYSAEFSQHRSYRPGDDLKYLDWKILGRTDRLYTRQFRETTSMSVMLVLDASASMAFGEPVSKIRYAQIVAAALAHLTVTQGDAVGLMTSGQGAKDAVFLPARSGRMHLRALLAALARLEAGGAWDPSRAIARGAELLGRRGLVLVLSDFYDRETETQRELRRAARRGHDVASLQVLSPAELTFDYAGELEVEDLETGARALVDAAAIRARYRDDLAAFVERTRRECLRAGLDYALLRTDVAPEEALRRFLIARAGTPAAALGPR